MKATVPALHYLTVNVTNRCNLCCEHCYGSTDAMMGREVAVVEILQLVREAKKEGLSTVLITGGEPFVRKDICELLLALKEARLKVLLATNCVLLTSCIAAVLKKTINKVNISIDGGPALHDRIRGQTGLFSKTLDNIQYLSRMGVPVSVSFTAHDNNWQDLRLVAEICRGLVVHLNIKRFISIGRGADCGLTLSLLTYDALIKEVRQLQTDGFSVSIKDPYACRVLGTEYGCFAGIHFLSIKHTGDIWICTKAPLKLGNIRTQCFREVWRHSPILQALRERKLEGACGRCAKRLMCGGCRAAALAFDGRLFGEDPLCSQGSQQRGQL